MAFFQRTIYFSTVILLIPLLVGLVIRRGYRACWAFPAYLVGVLGTNAVLAWNPGLLVWNFWLPNELLHSVLKFVLAAEVGWRIFGALPGARATLASALLLVSVVTLWTVIGASPQLALHTVAIAGIQRVNHGTAWVFGSLLAAKLYFRLPVHPLHQAILRGLVTYLMTFTVALGILETYGANVQPLATYGFALAYQLLLVYWNVVVWRKADDPQVPLEVMQKLQPWR